MDTWLGHKAWHVFYLHCLRHRVLMHHKLAFILAMSCDNI